MQYIAHGHARPWAMSFTEPTTWQDAAAIAVDLIFQQKRKRKRATIEQLRADLDDFIEILFHAPAGFTTASSRWAVIGGDAVELGETLGYEWLSPKTVHTTLVKKQRDYGPENIRRFGRQGLMVRMNDKVARLENILSSPTPPENETVFDNILDVIGYAAIGIMWESQQFLLPLTSKSSKPLRGPGTLG